MDTLDAAANGEATEEPLRKMNDIRLKLLKRRQETLFGCEAGRFARCTLLPLIFLQISQNVLP